MSSVREFYCQTSYIFPKAKKSQIRIAWYLVYKIIVSICLLGKSLSVSKESPYSHEYVNLTGSFVYL